MIRDWVEFGNPLPGQALVQRSVRLGLRHLRLERPSDPVAVPRRGARPAPRDAGGGHRPQPLHGPAAARHPGGVCGARCPAVLHPPPGPAAACRARHHHVRRNKPAVPGLDDLGDLPPRGRSGSRASRRLRAPGARCHDRAGRADPPLEPAGRLAGCGADDLRVAPVHGRADAVVRRPVAVAWPSATRHSPSRWQRSACR